MSSHIVDISQRQAARIAGSAYVIISVLALFANFYVLDRPEPCRRRVAGGRC
jgi:hypothetical protein